MTKNTKRRLLIVCFIIVAISTGLSILLNTLSDEIVFFYSPSELVQKGVSSDVRVGGLVKQGSITKLSNDEIEFIITDSTNATDSVRLKIHYKGLIPGLFREGQTIIAKGRMHDDIFTAQELLAKHDEYYMPNQDKS